jgi:hypothetical protein
MSRARISTTVVARFHYRHEAELAHGYLENAGVPTALFIDDAGGMDVGLAFVNPARVVVRVEDEERALKVLAEVGMLNERGEGVEGDSAGGAVGDQPSEVQEDVTEGS